MHSFPSIVSAAALGLTLCTAGTAFATPRVELEQRKLVEQAAAAWTHGQVAEAIALLERARELKPAGRVVFNLARAYEKNGDVEKAVLAYEEYLSMPDAEPLVMKRAKVALGILYKQTAKPPPAPPEPVVTTGPTPGNPPQDAPRVDAPLVPPSAVVEPPVQVVAPALPPAPRPVRTLGVVLLAAGVAAVGAGFAVGGWALSSADEARASVDAQRKPMLVQQAKDRATGADVTFVVGGVVAALGGTLWIVDEVSHAP